MHERVEPSLSAVGAARS